MVVDLNKFISPGTKLHIGPNEWVEYKRNLKDKRDKKIVTITSKSCKKFLTDINSERILEVINEPTLDSIDLSFKKIFPIYKSLKNNGKDISIIALGGGSVIDTAKILSLMLGNEISSSKYAIAKSKSSKLDEKIMIVCAPSTAGTGAETTPFSTIWDKKNGVKYSIITNKMNRTIILDPTLSTSLPKEITISSGIDALCQILESTWSKKSDEFSIESASIAYANLKNNFLKVIKEPNNEEYRLSMLVSSYLSGRSISISNTTLCHSISYPLTALLGVPHGLACGFTLIETIRFNSESSDKLLKNTLNSTGHDNSRELISEIESILKYSNINKYLINHKKNIQQNLDKVLPLTINRSRTTNNPRTAELSDILSIINNSLDRIDNA